MVNSVTATNTVIISFLPEASRPAEVDAQIRLAVGVSVSCRGELATLPQAECAAEAV